jgi:phosphoribosylglycinamide formyltransferase-1
MMPVMGKGPQHSPRIAVLASGVGSTRWHLAASSETGRLRGEVVLVLTTKAGAPVASQAVAAGVEHLSLDADALDLDGVDEAMRQALVQRDIDLVVLADGLWRIGGRTIEAFSGRIVNTRPAPPPGFGESMLSECVYQAVLDAGLRITAATVHLVDSEYDNGPALAATYVPVEPDDTAATLQSRVQAAERELLVQTLARLTDQLFGPADSAQRVG